MESEKDTVWRSLWLSAGQNLTDPVKRSCAVELSNDLIGHAFSYRLSFGTRARRMSDHVFCRTFQRGYFQIKQRISPNPNSR